MSYARSKASEIKVMMPHGNGSGAYHFSLLGSYKTFCGVNCERWVVSDKTAVDALDSAYTCKSCKSAFLR